MADPDKKEFSRPPFCGPLTDEAQDKGKRYSYDAFISYSRRDKAFAQRLEKALRAYKPPPGIRASQGHLRIFRDEEDFTGADYYPALAAHLKDSAKLLLICSPNARASPYVDDEIARFSQLNGAKNIVPILLTGVPNNEAQSENEGDLAFPRALCDVLQMPLAADYRDFDLKKSKVSSGRFEGSWYSILANLFEISRSEIEQRDRKRQLRSQRFVATAAGTVIAILTVALVFAITSRNEAVMQREAAISGKLVIESRMASSADLNLPLLLALEGLGFAPSEHQVRLLQGLAAKAPLAVYLPGIPDAVWDVAFSPDGKTLASVSKAGTVILWDIQSEKPIGGPLELTPWGEEAAVSGVAFSPDGKTVASVGKSGRINLWDIASRKRIGDLFLGHQSAISSIAFSPDGKVLALGRFDAIVTLWRLENHGPVSEPLEGHTGAVWSVAFSPDGKTLASGSEDGKIILWDAKTHLRVGDPLVGDGSRVTCVVFSPDGKKLASANAEGIIRLWDARKRVMVGEPIRAHDAPIWGLAFNPDGSTLASASWDRTLILWDVNTRRQIGQKFRGHGDVVWRIAFSPDGKTLASASEDTTVILWDLVTHQPRGEKLEGHISAVSAIDHTWDGAPIPQNWQPRYTSIIRISDPDLWTKRACEMSTRNMTCEEWRQFVGDMPYRKACPDIAGPDHC